MSHPDDPRQNDAQDDTNNSDLHDNTISQLYRQLPDEVPLENTDATILAAARRSVSARPHKQGFSPALQRLTATAAVFVLGIALVVQWQYREPEQLADVLATSSGSAASGMTPQTESPAALAEQDLSSTVENIPVTTPAPQKKKSADKKTSRKISADALKPEMASESGQTLPPPVPPAPLPASAAEYASKLSERRERNARQVESRMAASASAHAPALSAESAISHSLADTDMHEQEKYMSSGLLPYQHAMQMREWQSALESIPVTEKISAAREVDRDLLEQVLGRRQPPACLKLPSRDLGPDILLCQLLKQHAEGKPLPPDSLQQLQELGLITGVLGYRREAVLELMKQP